MRRGRTHQTKETPAEADKNFALQQSAIAIFTEHVVRYRENIHQKLITDIAGRLVGYGETVARLRATRPQLEEFEPEEADSFLPSSRLSTGKDDDDDDDGDPAVVGAGSKTSQGGKNTNASSKNSGSSSSSNHTANLAQYLKAAVGTLRQKKQAAAANSGGTSRALAATASAAAAVATGEDSSTSAAAKEKTKTGGGGGGAAAAALQSLSSFTSTRKRRATAGGRKAIVADDAGKIVIAKTKLVNWTLPDALKPVVPQLLQNASLLRAEAQEMARIFQELGAYIILSSQPLGSTHRVDRATATVSDLVIQNCGVMVNQLDKLINYRTEILKSLFKVEKRNPMPVHMIKTSNASTAQMLLASWDFITKGFTLMRRLCCLMHSLVAKNWKKLEQLHIGVGDGDPSSPAREIGGAAANADDDVNRNALLKLRRRKK